MGRVLALKSGGKFQVRLVPLLLLLRRSFPGLHALRCSPTPALLQPATATAAPACP